MNQRQPHYEVYTDGACKGNPGPGGWAAVVIAPNGPTTPLSGKEPNTTNNRMELMAALRALESLPKGAPVALFSDSAYLINTMTKGWKRGANLDLWGRLDALAKDRQIQWSWVPGHAGVPGNEFVNALAEYETGARKNRPRPEEFLPKNKGGQMPPDQLTHLDAQGRARQVDVGGKEVTQRESVAKGSVTMKSETLRLMLQGELEKGDALGVARLAGVMGAKLTPQLIPLCHPIPLDQVTVELEPDEKTSTIHITATARATARTGVEMEALVAVTTAALTLYDMAKAVDREMRIQNVRLVSKRGGKSGAIVLE
ncbi:MAG: cyclic pyranopterin monophosphate synthase MoaC [Dehalococcoidia bacterium]|nr:cyclic pyranopterin monophosphate synthase MoaC [Dehalococcoidia bacterium]